MLFRSAGFQAWLSGTSTLDVRFRQNLVSAALGTTATESGRLYLERPGKLRWDYLDPERKVALVADGSEIPFDLFLAIPKHVAPAVLVESGLTVATLGTDRPSYQRTGDDLTVDVALRNGNAVAPKSTTGVVRSNTGGIAHLAQLVELDQRADLLWRAGRAEHPVVACNDQEPLLTAHRHAEPVLAGIGHCGDHYLSGQTHGPTSHSCLLASDVGQEVF